MIFREFFATIKQLTGRDLKFHLFAGGDSDCVMHCFIFDAEAAQMQAFGEHVLTMNDSSISGIATEDPLMMVQHVAKTCSVHFCRFVILPCSVTLLHH